jgi:hypothetical protein
MDAMTRQRGFRLWIIVVIFVLVSVGIAFGGNQLAKFSRQVNQAFAAQSKGEEEPSLVSYGSPSTMGAVSTTPLIITSIASSTVTAHQCYQADDTQTMCFTVHNASPDGEWLDFVRLTFPDAEGAWTVACNSQDTSDSNGSLVNMVCNINSGREVTYTDNEVESPSIGEISNGASWTFCVDVSVPSPYIGPRIVNWGLSGDEDAGSGEPHDISGQLTLDQCTPLMLTPNSLDVEGCNGVQQILTFDLWNNSTNSGQVDLTYLVPSGNGSFSGPASFNMSAGEIVTFTVAITPEFNTKPGQTVSAELQASGLGEFESSTIEYTITSFAGWQRKGDSPEPTMDNAVAWAVHDGGLWSVGGYGSGGAAQRYDPETDNWITYTLTLTPYIEYPMDGCYGIDDGDEVITLFPDTIFTNTLQRFNITDKVWEEIPIPTGYPTIGRWAQDVVSLYNVTSFLSPGEARNLCYISGGSTEEGGGRVKNLWEYRPETNVTVYLGNFTLHQTGFAFHASWFVPWIGDQGSICVGGGIDFNSGILADTECYDISATTFRGENVDLGQLPEPWWGMADGWQIYDGEYQIWLANGVAQDGTLLPASAYASETSGGFQAGPMLPEGLYRLEGDGWNGQFFTEGGSQGGFSYSKFNYLLAHCPSCYEIFIPLVMR